MKTPNPQTIAKKEKTDSILEQAAKRAAGAEADNGNQAPSTMTRAEVIKLTPRARMEFFKSGGKFKDA